MVIQCSSTVKIYQVQKPSNFLCIVGEVPLRDNSTSAFSSGLNIKAFTSLQFSLLACVFRGKNRANHIQNLL